MRWRHVLAVVSVAAVGLMLSTPAAADTQELPDLPGMGTVSGSTGTGVQADQGQAQAGSVPAALPASRPGNGIAARTGNGFAGSPAFDPEATGAGTLGTPIDTSGSADTLTPTADSVLPATGTEAAASPAGERRSLPRTGSFVLGYALVGIALMSGGRMLIELSRP